VKGRKGYVTWIRGQVIFHRVALVVGPAPVEMWHVENVCNSVHVIGAFYGPMFPKSVDKFLTLEIDAACLAATSD
jgi:hypothetical protein